MRIVSAAPVVTLAAAMLALAPGVSEAQGTRGYGTNVFAGIRTDKASYGVGEPVKITFLIRNRSDQPVTYRFSSGKQFDVWAEKGGAEVWRLSHGMMYTQAFTSLTIPAGSTKGFDAVWKQVDDNGKAVGRGTYTIRAQITPVAAGGGRRAKGAVAPVSVNISLRGRSAGIAPTTVSRVVTNAPAFKGKLVSISGTFRGWRADGQSAACKAGPPVSRSDWAVSDKTGCIYAHGTSGGLNPTRDYGKHITVQGRVTIARSGLPYLEVRSVEVTAEK